MDKSYLTDKIVVQLHLHASKGHPIHVKSSSEYSKYIVKIDQETFEKAENNDIQLKILRKNACLTVENHLDASYGENDFFIYSTWTRDLSCLVFKIYVNIKNSSTTSTSIGCHGYLPSCQMAGSTGSTTVTLYSEENCQYMGTILVDYLVVHPMQSLSGNPTLHGDQSVTSLGHKANGQYFVSGHRGAGESFNGLSPYPENTISAFKAASSKGIDFVEMDVQVSRDKIPVVFHDTTVKLSAGSTLVEVPVKNLTLEQMKTAKVAGIKEHEAYIKAKAEIKTQTDLEVEADFQLFPTLCDVFDKVPEETGFIIELKFPLEEMGAGTVDEEAMDENEFLDAILQVVLNKVRNRRVVLASFDANICTMSQLKQTRFPVYFITQDNTTIWTPYVDLRTRHIDSAIAFAKSANLSGIHTFSNEMLNSPERMSRVIEANLVLSLWGSPNEDPATRQWLYEHGASILQVDDIFAISTSS